jgi:lipopolysaccharide/colanic/teichoic acid biosynthesis glycosyltransferase
LYEAAKRTIDVVLSGALLVLLVPVWLAIGLLVKLNSPGSVFFVHERVGKDGRRFRLLKFRTMQADADPYARTAKSERDPRLTRFGRFLRDRGLDELPQLLNVVKGDMSLVGPRPEMPFIVDTYTESERRRLALKPGITGLWQVLGPRHRPIHEHLRYDLYYLRHRSLALDFWILFWTMGIVVSGKRRQRVRSRGM